MERRYCHKLSYVRALKTPGNNNDKTDSFLISCPVCQMADGKLTHFGHKSEGFNCILYQNNKK